MKKKLIVLALLLVAGVPLVFAQTRGAFTIQCNVTGAKVYLNGELAGYTKPTFSALLQPGTYTVRVAMERYQTFETTIRMTTAPLNLNVNLVREGTVQPPPPPQQGRYTLSVTSNVAGAQVFVNNSPVGSTPLTLRVNRGSYSIRVTAPGYQDYVASLNVSSNSAVNAVLQQALLQLSIDCNVPGAQVYVNNTLVGTAPFRGAFAPGSYQVRVSASGYGDATAVVNLNRNQAISLDLQPHRLLRLTVDCNVSGAEVYINNSLVGTAPYRGTFAPGAYSVRVTAPGYGEASTVVNLNRHESISLNLQPQRLQLTVNCNVPGAQVYINNTLVGNAPFYGSFAPGTYSVRVLAPGYSEARTVVVLNRSETLSLVLQPSLVYVQISIPPEFLEPQHKNPWSQIKIYVDGEFYNSLSFTLLPGTHNIRISSGGLSFSADYDFTGGQDYVLEPAFGWQVR